MFDEYCDEYETPENIKDIELACIISIAAHEQVDAWVKRVNEDPEGEDIHFLAAEHQASAYEFVTLKKWEINDRLTKIIFHQMDQEARDILHFLANPDVKLRDEVKALHVEAPKKEDKKVMAEEDCPF